MQTLLTIAGFDPSSGAGITADLAVIAAHGHFGTAAPAALTVQSTLGVRAVHPVDAHILAATLDCLAEDLPPAGIKIGMLATEANVQVVAAFLAKHARRGPVVLDPVLVSSSGSPLLDPGALVSFRNELLPWVGWITPNLHELAVLTGLPVTSPAQVEHAAAKLQTAYPKLNVLATGGHLPEPDDLWLSPQGTITWYPGTRIQSRATHGTGCAFSTALTCNLVSGLDASEAIHQAKHFVVEAIRQAPQIGHGVGPLNLLWPLQAPQRPPA